MAIRPRDVYHGRRRGRTALTVIVCVLVVLLAAAIALFYGLKKYAVVGPDGVVRFDFPSLQSDAPAPSADASPGGEALIIDTPSADGVSFAAGRTFLPTRAPCVFAGGTAPADLKIRFGGTKIGPENG